MRNICILAAFVLVYTNVPAQGIPVSHTIEKRNVVLEDFTGIHCVNCPNGHYYENLLLTNHPEDVVIINVHTGGYAEPGVGEPDFRTDFGTALENMSDLTGYPSATINRHKFSTLGEGGTAIVNRGNWAKAADSIFAQNSLANLGVEADIDVQSNLLTVRVQVYYTGNPNYPTNARINVALLQDDVEGPQTGMNANPTLILPNGKYLHKHILRHLLTGQYGAKPPFSVGAGVTADTTIAYLLPADIRDIPLLLSKLKVAAFVSDGINEIITGHLVYPTFVNFPSANSSKVLSAVIENNAVCGFTTAPTVTIQNFGSSPLTSLYFDYSINGSPTKTMYWTGNLPSMGEEQVTLNNINFFSQPSNELTVNTRLPNGNADPDADDDEATVTFGNTVDISNTITMTLQLDHYGEEVTWQLVNSAGTALYSGGPYADTPEPSTGVPLPAPITKTFNLASGDCYEFLIQDDYGDGLLSASSGFTLEDDLGYKLLNNLKNYGAGTSKPFGVDAPQADSSDVFPPDTTSNGIASLSVGSIAVFPNPSTNKISVNLDFANEQALTIYMTDVLGKRVRTIAENQQIAGSLQVSVVEFTPGIYFLNAEVAGKKYMQKIFVNR